MEVMDSEVEKHMNGYNLPPDSLWEIKRALERRYRNRFSEGLSPEGRIAMQQVQEYDEPDGVVVKEKQKTKKALRPEKTKRRPSVKQNDKRKRTISFSDTYRNSSANRLDGDITDEAFDDSNLKKRAIGGKLESAMETIEIVKHGEEPSDSLTGETAIDETAKLNSVEKCIVWMEVNDDVNNDVTAEPSIPDSARSDNSIAHIEP